MRNCLITLLLAATVASGAEGFAQTRPSKKRWWASVAIAAASFMDMHSSWGKREMNPMLRGPDGRFRAGGVVIKASLLGTSCGLQWLLLKKEPQLKNTLLSGINVGLAAWWTAAAAHNW